MCQLELTIPSIASRFLPKFDIFQRCQLLRCVRISQACTEIFHLATDLLLYLWILVKDGRIVGRD